MNPQMLRFLSYTGVTLVMVLSAAHFYKTWQNGDPRWYFMIMALAIAILLLYNVPKRRKR